VEIGSKKGFLMKHYRFLLFLIVIPLHAIYEQEKLFAQKFLSDHQGDLDTVILFAPDQAETIHQLLVGLIALEEKCIKIAAFRLTEPLIAAALIDAHKRGVVIELVVDADALSPQFSGKPLDLGAQGVPLYVFQPPTKESEWLKGSPIKPLMHYKFMMFEQVCGKKIVWFGSLNFTKQALNGNQEYVSLRAEKAVVQQFEEQFQRLKGRSVCYKPELQMALEMGAAVCA